MIMELFFYIVAFLCGVCISNLFLSKSSDSAYRRDIKELIEFKEITISSGDVLVLRFDREVDREITKCLQDNFSCLLDTGIKVLILRHDMSIHSVLRRGSQFNESNIETGNSNKESQEPSPVSAKKINDDASK
ncbi:hypothetical protein ABD07_00310 [Nitrosomonas oligotropha]|nr:hypothetical protein [Nitrosomonas oligotropha]